MPDRSLPDDDGFTSVVVAGDTAQGTVANAHARRLCDGHFPGDALVPGAYLAELMADLAARLVDAETDAVPSEVVRCVFLAPVRPHAAIEVRAMRAGAAALVDAEVWADGTRAARARFRFRAA
jgi:3-hydroxymyristoyl/3-hydroxydecanoyl-(acyl carrier protein) dehydratase